MDDKTLARMRRLSTVPRWGVIPTIQSQNVAEHSFHVASIAGWLCQFTAYCDSLDKRGLVIQRAMVHDSREAVSGDIPSPYKKFVDDPEDVHEEGQLQVIIKLADLLESIAFLKEETAMGNGRVTPVINSLMGKLELVFTKLDLAINCGTMTFAELMKKFETALSPYSHPIMEEL